MWLAGFVHLVRVGLGGQRACKCYPVSLRISADSFAQNRSACAYADDTATGMMAGQGDSAAPTRRNAMQEFRHVLETRGRYQLVAVS